MGGGDAQFVMDFACMLVYLMPVCMTELGL